MKKRKSITYLQPVTLGDLKQILIDHEMFPPTTRIWIHSHSDTPGDSMWHSIEVSHAEEPK